MSQYSDPGIPTLTQRAEPAATPAQPRVNDTAHRTADDLPVLTDIAESTEWSHSPDIVGGADTPQAALSTTSVHSTPTSAVLRAALQAELEQALHRAVEDASIRLRARLEAELPALIDRAVSQVRPG